MGQAVAALRKNLLPFSFKAAIVIDGAVTIALPVTGGEL